MKQQVDKNQKKAKVWKRNGQIVLSRNIQEETNKKVNRIIYQLLYHRSGISQYNETETTNINKNLFGSKHQQNSKIYRISKEIKSRRTKTSRDR